MQTTTKFNVGDICRYEECPPNWGKMRELNVWTNDTISLAQKEWEEQSATVQILEVFEADGDEPESYKIKFLDSPDLQDQWQGHGIALLTELSPIEPSNL